MKSTFFCILIGLILQTNAADNFAKDKLVAWCIVPFDAKQRGPAARAEMLQRLGLKRVAYDWRAKHVKEFEDEILQYKKHGLEFFAFWAVHEKAFALFEKHKISPQVWYMFPQPKGDTQEGMTKPVPTSRENLNKEAIIEKWALNYVGTSYFIMGRAYAELGKKEEALQAYQHLVVNFPFAHCWDPKGYFWKPAVAAKKRIKELESKPNN
jgi:hypothetical protein